MVSTLILLREAKVKMAELLPLKMYQLALKILQTELLLPASFAQYAFTFTTNFIRIKVQSNRYTVIDPLAPCVVDFFKMVIDTCRKFSFLCNVLK